MNNFVFDPRFPVYTIADMTYRGKKYQTNTNFDWESMGIDLNTVRTLFTARKLYHNPKLDVELKIGDQLGEVTLKQLDAMVDKMNAYIYDLTGGGGEYQNRKIKKGTSTNLNKRVGMTRSWLRNYPTYRDKFYEFRDEVLAQAEESK